MNTKPVDRRASPGGGKKPGFRSVVHLQLEIVSPVGRGCTISVAWERRGGVPGMEAGRDHNRKQESVHSGVSAIESKCCTFSAFWQVRSNLLVGPLHYNIISCVDIISKATRRVPSRTTMDLGPWPARGRYNFNPAIQRSSKQPHGQRRAPANCGICSHIQRSLPKLLLYAETGTPEYHGL